MLNNTFPITDFGLTKQKVLSWLQQFDTFCFLDNHQYAIEPHSVECIAGAGAQRRLQTRTGQSLQQLQKFIDDKKSWLFGHIGYDLKNEMNPLVSAHPDHIGFPDLFFFEPSIIIRIQPDRITIEAKDPTAIYNQIISQSIKDQAVSNGSTPISKRLEKEEYLSVIRQLQRHILRGDCYEINFCMEFFAEQTIISPLAVYNRLAELSPNPFSGLYRLNDRWLICASPERFLARRGDRVLSQPIKGTGKRYTADPQKDKSSRDNLYNSSKDRSENVMIVDLVRNDLSRICQEGSVTVDELYGIYSFPQVHQMISTISGVVKGNVTFTDMIRATFPVGSMTGAPKLRVMELIEEYEKTRRGIFSGALGYISPTGDFDFNVVIRSLMYNAANKYLSFQAGSGITFYSDPEAEWEECLLKAEAIKQVLSSF